MTSFFRICCVAVFLAGCALGASSAFAAVYQGKGASGAVAFSDRPCLEDAKGGEILVRPASGAGSAIAPQGKAGSAARTTADDGPMDAALTPACREMQARMTEVEQSRLSEAEIEALVARYSKDCVPLLRAAQDAERANQKYQAAGEIKRNECDNKRKVVQDRRARWAQLTQVDRAAAITLEKDVADACR